MRNDESTEIRPLFPMNKKLPLIVISVFALAMGLFVALQTNDNRVNSASAVSSENESAALRNLQDKLQTSLALPLDFRTVPDFNLLDVNAQPITEAVFDGHWSIVFFGYTHCPDVCPITLQVMKNVNLALAEQNQKPVQVVFVSVDPVRDTSDVMKNYISYFNEDFIGITGDLNAVHALTSSLGIVASFTANKDDPENYIVDHTASLLLIDPQKRLRAKISPPHETDSIVADYLTVMAAPE